jgi:hypothetical protein
MTSFIFQPSIDSIINSIRLKDLSEDEIINEYLNYPKLPYGKTIKIDKISILNYNALTNEYQNKITYLPFRIRLPDEFEEAKDPNLDYTDAEQVSPDINISNNQKFRVKKDLWFPLRDIVNKILIKQGKTNKKCLPINIFIDDKDQFMLKLFNLTIRKSMK